MKKINITLTTYLTYYDKEEQLEIELEDAMAEQLEAFANGKEVTNEQLEEGLPEVYEEIDYEAYSRAHDLLIIDGYKNCGECYSADFTKLHEMFDESGFDGDFEEWMSKADERIAQMDTAEYAEYLEEIYGIECEAVEGAYTFTYNPCDDVCQKPAALSMADFVASGKKKSLSVTFTYEGQFIFSVEGQCTVEMTAEDFILFNHFNNESKEEEVDDVLEFFKEHMHKSLYDEIRYAIKRQIRYNDAKETIEREGRYCFEDMDEDEYESMTTEELISRYLEDNIDGIVEFLVEDIEIISPVI